MNTTTTTDENSRTLTIKSHACVIFTNNNSHDYSLFDMYFVSNYMNNQLIYYFIISVIFVADQAEF